VFILCSDFLETDLLECDQAWFRGRVMAESKDRGIEKPVYLSYLLRLWWEDESGREEKPNGPIREPVWRASLQDPSTGERRGFVSLAALFHFLWQATAGERGTGSLADESKEGGDA
jgi:hypothetical protein